MRSEAEQELRDAVVARLRQLLPAARIVHELNTDGTGSRRMDLAAVGDCYVVGVELKSKWDTLARLEGQVTQFRKVCHRLIVALDEKHREARYTDEFKALPTFTVWNHPSPPMAWRLDTVYLDPMAPQPRARDLLGLLWHDELQFEMRKAGIAAAGNRETIIRAAAWHLSGKDIVELVCRRLREREFAEADPRIVAIPARNYNEAF